MAECSASGLEWVGGSAHGMGKVELYGVKEGRGVQDEDLMPGRRSGAAVKVSCFTSSVGGRGICAPTFLTQ
jgi:hypothetical protein